MPTLTYDSQSFSWNGKRLWLVGVNLEYALLAPERWKQAIASLKQMGFNTIRASVPWCLHEVRRGRFGFTHGLDVAAFARECRAQGMHLVLRIGPVVGEPFDGGGLPAWLPAEPGAKPRQVNEAYLRRVSALYRAIAEQVVPLQATQAQGGKDAAFGGARASEGGPLLAVQIEHGWTCGNETVGAAYHAELLRFARECGFTVPVLTNNGLWISTEGCVEVWEGWDNLFMHMRQLQAVQPDAPRMVEIREEAARAAGATAGLDKRAGGWTIGMDFLSRMGQILAAGGQPILPGVQRTDRSNAVPALLDAGGRPNPALRSLRRMVSFANHFGHVYADADASLQTTVQAPDALRPGGFSVIVVEGNAGRVNFVFRGPDSAKGERFDETSLITSDGARLQVQLGDAPVGWYLFDVSLHGKSTLDWCNLSPFALIDRSVLVLQGPAGAEGALSIDGAELEFTLPDAKAGAKPFVAMHQGMVIVGCNQQQIDTTVVEAHALVVGAERVLHDGSVELAAGITQAWRVHSDGTLKAAVVPKQTRKPAVQSLNAWQSAPNREFVTGQSDRFATLSGPASLGTCGAYEGWGWYRVQWKGGKSAVMLPGAAGFMQLWLDGKPLGTLQSQRLPLQVAAGAHTLTVLARQGGQSATSASAGVASGLPLAPHVVEPIACKTSVVDTSLCDPFKASAFIAGYSPGQPMSTNAVKMVLQQRRKDPILIDAPGEVMHALIVLNGRPHAVIDWRGEPAECLVLHMATREAPKVGLQQGANEVLVIPFDAERARVDRLAKAMRTHISVQALEGKAASWAFARWAPPSHGGNAWVAMNGKARAATRGNGKAGGSMDGKAPLWFSTAFERNAKMDGPVELLCSGLSRGHVFVNDELVGAYDTADGREVVELPSERLAARNSITIFDLEGRAPAGVKVRG